MCEIKGKNNGVPEQSLPFLCNVNCAYRHKAISTSFYRSLYLLSSYKVSKWTLLKVWPVKSLFQLCIFEATLLFLKNHAVLNTAIAKDLKVQCRNTVQKHMRV